jgi:serine/threonine-protein kinase RsbW
MDSAPVKIEVTVPSDVRVLAFVSKIMHDTVHLIVADAARADTLAATIDVCLTEALTNAIQHAHKSEASRPVKLIFDTAGGVLTIRIFDTGPGFDMKLVPEPDFEALKEHGRGLFIIKNSMDSLSYTPIPGGNVLEMSKRLLSL